MAITGPSPARPLGAGEADAGPALAEIAFSLGYSEVSAFNHGPPALVGQSPGDHRQLRAVHLESAAANKSEPPR